MSDSGESQIELLGELFHDFTRLTFRGPVAAAAEEQQQQLSLSAAGG